MTTRLPLNGFKVIDLTAARAGPTAVRQLADWGADVIKIENPGGPAVDATGSVTADQIIIYDQKSGNLYYDGDGSGDTIAQVNFARIGKGLDLAAGNFFGELWISFEGQIVKAFAHLVGTVNARINSRVNILDALQIQLEIRYCVIAETRVLILLVM